MSDLYELTQKYCERITHELEDQFKKIEKANPIPVSDIEIIDTLWHSLKSIKTVESMDEYDNRSEYSGRSIRIPNINYGYSGNDYSGRNRNRDSMGRYSGHNDTNELMNMLEDKMRYVRSEDEAMAIRDAMNSISRIK